MAKEAFKKLAKVIGELVPSEFFVDSTHLEDPRDPNVRVGFYSQGPFKGFKIL